MADNVMDTPPADMLHVNVTRYSDIRYWSKQFHCTPDQLRDAVKVAGTSAAAVKEHLAKR